MDAVHVVGAGGIGCAVGYALRAANVPVVFVESDPAKRADGKRNGVRVDQRPALRAEFVAPEAWAPPPGALVLLCTKCYDNAAILPRLRGTTVVPVQNGFDPLLDAQPHRWEGIASFVSQCDPGRAWTWITRRGCLHVGGRLPAERGSLSLPGPLRLLGEGGLFRLVEVDAIAPYKHAKLMYNAAVSPLAAAAGVDNGRLLSYKPLRRLFFALLAENHQILHAAGIELERIGPLHPRHVAAVLRQPWLARGLAWAFEPSLRGTYCSMAGEIQKGRTELENYNGHLIRLAALSGVACPLNQAVYAVVTAMTKAHARPSVSAFGSLAA